MFELFLNLNQLFFWLSVSGIAFTYAGYPAVLWLITRWVAVAEKGESVVMADAAQSELPHVALIVAAFNEEKDIEQRVHNLLAQDYPGDSLQLFIGSDGSTDKTNEILESFRSHPQVTLGIFTENRGKASVLNDLVALASQPILVFTDANTDFEPDNISKLVQRFTPSVGGVCGELQIYDPQQNSGDNKDSLYWQYERFLKKLEGKLRCLPGANGANYAIRRELYQPLPAATIVDDFVIACNVVLAGWDMVYAAEASAKEEQAPDVKAEFKRRVRIGSGNYQALGWLQGKVRAHTTLFQFVFVSHKVLRWFVPHLLVLCLLSSLVLSFGSAWFAWVLALQLIGYLLCLVVYTTQGNISWPAPIKILYFLISMNLALGIGFYRYIQGAARPTWQRTER